MSRKLNLTKGTEVNTDLGPGKVVEVIEKEFVTKYRVAVQNRGDSFIFFAWELF